MMVDAFVLPVVSVGMMEASTIGKPSIPCTRSSEFTTAIGSVPRNASTHRMGQRIANFSDVSGECLIASHVNTGSQFLSSKLIKGIRCKYIDWSCCKNFLGVQLCLVFLHVQGVGKFSPAVYLSWFALSDRSEKLQNSSLEIF